MLKTICLLFCLLCYLATAATAQPRPVRIIFDTDMGNDIDDALALAMIHAFETRHEAELLGVTITKDNVWAARYVDLVNTFYGRGRIPIGVVKNGVTPEESQMIKAPAERRNPDGSLTYPRTHKDDAALPDAVALLRQLLAREADGAVTIIQVGFSTNLARLLDTPGDAVSALTGKELVARKVRLLSLMAGNFVYAKPEYNVHKDAVSARKLFAEWPTLVVASGFEIGEELLYPATSIERHFGYVANHPIADAYRNYMKMPYDRPTWDLTAVLYAVRPGEHYFDLSPKGTITVREDSNTKFQMTEGGRHQYLVLNPKQAARIIEAFVNLASQPPLK